MGAAAFCHHPANDDIGEAGLCFHPGEGAYCHHPAQEGKGDGFLCHHPVQEDKGEGFFCFHPARELHAPLTTVDERELAFLREDVNMCVHPGHDADLTAIDARELERCR